MVYLDYDPNDEDDAPDFQIAKWVFCGDKEPHEPHDDEGTAVGSIFIHTCPGFDPDEE